MIDITELDGCHAFDEHLMEASIVGVVSAELGAHLEGCPQCAVAMANYQLATRAIRGSGVTAPEYTPAAPIHTGNPKAPRRPSLRILGPRALILAASIAAALLALVHFGSKTGPGPQDGKLIAKGTGAAQNASGLSAKTVNVSTGTPTEKGTPGGSGTTIPGHPATAADGTQVLVAQGPGEKLDCIDVGGRCFCCVGCDIQTLVGNDLPEHRIPAALQGLKIGDRVTSSTLPSGGFIVDERSSLL